MQELNVINNTYDINKKHTSCKDCIFAIYNEKTQQGCAANMFKKFNSNNITKTLVYDKDDNEFYVINNINCPSFRNEKWKNDFHQKKNLYCSLNELLSVVKEQNKCKFYIMLYIAPQTLNCLVQDSINQCLTNQYKHIKYVFVCHQDKYNDIVFELRNSKLKDWRIETIIEDCKFERAIDIAQKKAKDYHYSAVYRVGSSINFSLLSKINDSVENFKNLALIYDGDGIIFYNRIYTLLGGNFDKSFIEKVKLVVKETKEDHLIKNGDEL